MDRIIDTIMSVWDYPVFQHLAGIFVGAVTIGALWAITAAYRCSKEIKRLEKQNNWSERWNEKAAEMMEETE